MNQAMTMSECLDALLAREDADKIKLSRVVFDLLYPPMPLEGMRERFADWDRVLGRVFVLTPDGIVHIGEGQYEFVIVGREQHTKPSQAGLPIK